MHIVQAPRVRLKAANDVCSVSARLLEPSLFIRQFITESEPRFRSGPTRVLPLGFCGQHKVETIWFSNSFDESLSIVPGNLFDGSALSLGSGLDFAP